MLSYANVRDECWGNKFFLRNAVRHLPQSRFYSTNPEKEK